MKINRAPHIPWVIFVLAATAVASFLFVANFHPQRMPPAFRFFGEKPPDHATIGGTPLGLIFGAVSLAIFVFAAFLGVRKKMPILRASRAMDEQRGTPKQIAKRYEDKVDYRHTRTPWR
ncbi:MAG TPA: hypothetical protein VGP40_02860, partial [Chthoniobacterales bacterium]|nr:hypothetical protein [Chthoniobacterales bacterium]